MTGGYTVPEIREMTNTYYDKTIRKLIHKFNNEGTEGLVTKNRLFSYEGKDR